MNKKYLAIGIIFLLILISSAIFIGLTINCEDCNSYYYDDNKNNNEIINSKQEKNMTNIKTISVSDFKEKLETGDNILIDIRTTPELVGTGIIPGAVHIDSSNPDFIDKLNNLDKNKKYLIYCRSGNRSSQALTIMGQLGFTDVFDLNGGINVWISSGEEVEKYNQN